MYDIPILGSLKQQLADEHILDEVGYYVVVHYHIIGVSKDAAHFNLFCIVPLYKTLCSH